MRFTHSSATRQQFLFLQRQFLQEGDLPFTNVLTQEFLSHALDSIQVVWKDRVYTPLVMLRGEGPGRQVPLQVVTTQDQFDLVNDACANLTGLHP